MKDRPMTSLVQATPAGLLALAAALALAACGGERSGSDPAEDMEKQIERVDAQVRDAPTGADSGLPVRGSIHAQFDGQQRQWDITTLDDDTLWSAATYDDSYQVNIGIRGDAAPGQPEGRFMLELAFESAQGFRAGGAPEVIVSLIPHLGIMPPLWAGRDDGDIRVTLDRAEFDGQSGRVEGSFSGTLCYRATLTQNPDPTNCKPIEGRFATDLAAARD